MNAKKLLAVLVACAMIFGTMSFGVLASEDVELIETEEIAEEVVSEEAVEAAATELYVNCDYNSSTEGYGVTCFNNYSAALNYANANAKNATIVIEKTNTLSGNCIDHSTHRNLRSLNITVKDGAVIGNANSKWDVTYDIVLEPGSTLRTARGTGSSVGYTHVKDGGSITVGSAGAAEKAVIDFQKGTHQDMSIAVLWQGTFTANNAHIKVADLGFTGTSSFNDCIVDLNGVVAFGKNNFYNHTVTNTTITSKGTNIYNDNNYFSNVGTLLNGLTLTNSSITVDNGEAGVATQPVFLKKVTMNASTISVDEDSDVSVEGAVAMTDSTIKAGTVTVTSGGSIKVDNTVVAAASSSTPSLDVKELIIESNGKVVIDSASFVSAASISGDGTIEIDASSFAGGTAIPLSADLSSFTGSINVVNSSNPNTTVIPDGNGNLVLMNAVASVDDVIYDDLQTAINNGKNKTVKLLGNVTIDENSAIKWNGDTYYSIGVAGNVTLDLNGYTVNGKAGSDSNHYALFCYQTKDAVFTITDSSAAKSGAIINDPVKYNSNKYSNVIYNNGNIVIDGVLVENKIAEDKARTYAIENVTVATTGLTVQNGAKIISAQGRALNLLSQGAGGSQNVVISEGEIGGDVRVVLKNGSKDTMNFAMSGGNINGNLSIQNYAAEAAGAASDSVVVTGGEISGEFKVQPSVDSTSANLEISGGVFGAAPAEKYVAESYVLTQTDSGKFTVVADTNLTENINVEFKSTSDERIYDIVLKADGGYYMNRFSNADLTFVNNSNGVSYEILKRADGIVNINGVPGNSDRYEFHFNGVNAPSETGFEIVIGQVKLNGYGEVDFSVLGVNTNMAHTAELTDNIVATYIPGGATDGNDKTGELVTSGAVIDGVEIKEATVPVKVVIEFNNNITEGNTADYNDMTITLSGANGELHTGKIGSGSEANVVYADGKALVTFEFPEVTVGENGYYYTVMVKGAGYRNATLTKRLRADLTEAERTYLFWNNVKDVEGDNFLAGDIVKDNIINIYDLSAVVSYFGEEDLVASNPGYAKYDLNRDGKIDSKDVAYVLVSWGK